jgi:hypothetical protein
MGKQRRRKARNLGYSSTLMRTAEEREEEVHKIMDTLTTLGLTATYSAVRELLPILSAYARDGVRTPISIEVPEVGRRMVGVLAASKREEVWLRLERYT